MLFSMYNQEIRANFSVVFEKQCFHCPLNMKQHNSLLRRKIPTKFLDTGQNEEILHELLLLITLHPGDFCKFYTSSLFVTARGVFALLPTAETALMQARNLSSNSNRGETIHKLKIYNIKLKGQYRFLEVFVFVQQTFAVTCYR